MTKPFDVVILGTGPAASRIAERCAADMQVAMVEAREIGGECALRGCNPKKVFVNAADLLERVRRADGKLLNAGTAAPLDWRLLVDFKNQFTDPIPDKSLANFQKLGIAIFRGEGHFVAVDQLAAGSDVLTAKFFAICTGAEPAPLQIPGEDLVTTSDQFMDLEELPHKVVFIGGGFIAFEFAHVARSLGCEVTVIDRNPRPLTSFDVELVEKLCECSRASGIQILTDSDVIEVRKLPGGLEVRIDGNSEVSSLTAGLVVHGAGRVPSMKNLGLKAGNIQCCEQGILVNQFMQSVSNDRVFAAGDVAATDQAKLTPVANEQGFVVGKNLSEGIRHVPEYGAVPSVVFTVPPLAAVGMTEQTAQDLNVPYEVLRGSMDHWTSVRKFCGSCAEYKILVDRQSQKILGAHLLGPAADDMINLFTVAMQAGMTRQQLKRSPLAFPTFTADIRNML